MGWSLHSRSLRCSHTAPRIVAAVAALLALGLTTTPGIAAGRGNTPVRGIVIGISSERMEIQSATGSVAVAISDETRVIRTVSGTVADLRKGQIVEIVLDARSGRVNQLHIAPPGTKLGEAPPFWGPGRGAGQAKNRAAQIRAVSAKTIRVRYANGRVVTYRLVSKPKVIKDVPGRIGDIAIGQTVFVTRSQGGRVANVIVLLRG